MGPICATLALFEFVSPAASGVDGGSILNLLKKGVLCETDETKVQLIAPRKRNPNGQGHSASLSGDKVTHNFSAGDASGRTN